MSSIADRPDTTTLSYWLNWRVLLCAVWILTSMIFASYLIWKYEGSAHSKRNKGKAQEELPQLFCDDDAWKTCLRELHPIWLLAYRVMSFSVFLVILVFDGVKHGSSVLFFYTQWTFTLVTIFFGFGAALSIYGCYMRYKIGQRFHVYHVDDQEPGSYLSLASWEPDSSTTSAGQNTGLDEENCGHAGAGTGIWGFLFQVMFQMIAGAVLLTDCVYWSIIFPFLTIREYDLHFMTFIMHSLNAVFLIGDTALNCLRFPWFRISYFILWTSIFVISQWIIHACVSIWWPYPFLDLSSPYAPLWYFLVGLMHIPCYGLFVLIVEMKVYVLSKWFPQSCQCIR